MTWVKPLVNTERLVVGWQRARLGSGYKVGTELPIPAEPALPFTRVTADPGDEDSVTSRYRVVVECFAATRDAMWDLARETHAAMAALSGSVHEGQLVDRVRTDRTPAFVPWSPTVFRTAATYVLELRPASGTA